jgi:hypothetical protein
MSRMLASGEGASRSASLASFLAAASVAIMSYASGASAQTCPAFTYSLTNGTTADASQVMSNFNTV